jgi:hypothetical protein
MLSFYVHQRMVTSRKLWQKNWMRHWMLLKAAVWYIYQQAGPAEQHGIMEYVADCSFATLTKIVFVHLRGRLQHCLWSSYFNLQHDKAVILIAEIMLGAWHAACNTCEVTCNDNCCCAL